MRVVRVLEPHQVAARLPEKHQRLGLHASVPERQKVLAVEALQFIDKKHARHKTHVYADSGASF